MSQLFPFFLVRKMLSPFTTGPGVLGEDMFNSHSLQVVSSLTICKGSIQSQ